MMWTKLVTAIALVLAGALATPALADETPRSSLVWWQFEADFSSAHVVIADAQARHARAITNPGPGFYDREPTLSPDGRSVLVERELPSGHAQVVVVDIRRGTERVIDTNCDDPCNDDILPTWLPDGHHIAFTRVRGLFDPTIVGSVALFSENLSGRHLRRLSEPGIDGLYEDNAARFSPDGRSAVVARIRSADLKIALFRLDLDSRPATQLTDWSLAADEPDYSPARSGPTKDSVVFYTFGGPEPGPFQDIATLPAFCQPLASCTSSIRLLTHHAVSGGVAFGPTWSVNGRRVVFSEATPDGSPDLWTAKPDGSDRRRLTDTPDVLELSPDAGLAVAR